jgi:hypothetical protein
VQTFLAYPDFAKSVKVLDWRRLGKQRVEAFQLLCANGCNWALAERQWRIEQGLMKDKPLRKGWVNHPATVMWREYDQALAVYMNLAIAEWESRGYQNTMRYRPYLYNEFFGMKEYRDMVDMPLWLGDPQFHASHRSNLLRKDPEYYSQFGWTEGPDLEYVWPE